MITLGRRRTFSIASAQRARLPLFQALAIIVSAAVVSALVLAVAVGNPTRTVRQYGLTVRPAGGVEVAGSPTVFVG